MAEQYTIESLRKKISELEKRQVDEGKMLKTQLKGTIDNLKPLNVIKSVVNDVFESKSLRKEFANAVAGYVSGLISKKLVVGNSNNPATKLLGLGIQLATTTIISKNFTVLKEIIVQLAGTVFTKIQEDILLNNSASDNE